MNIRWKVLIVANLVASSALGFICLELYKDRENLRVELFLELAKQDILLKHQENNISDLKQTIAGLSRRMNTYESYGSEAADYPDQKIDTVFHSKDAVETNAQTRQRNFGFTIDSGECQGWGDNVVGLFVDILTKCPGNIYGY